MELNPSKKHFNKQIGAWGEQITANYYKKAGFSILTMNYLQKWGEIDVIAEKGSKVHFIEVKAVSYETKLQLKSSVAHGTWRPEENVHSLKIKKLTRAIDTWLSETKWEGEWQIDVATVWLVPRETYAIIKIIPNIILS